jgi:hypothetical protein
MVINKVVNSNGNIIIRGVVIGNVHFIKLYSINKAIKVYLN